MELNLEAVDMTPLDAATVVLLRDHPRHGLQVLLLQRHSASKVLGGAYVFAGGKLDAADQQSTALSRLDAPADTLHRQLGEPALPAATAAGLFVAAIREAWEESGVLFSQADPATLEAGEPGWQQLMASPLQLQSRALTPWCRWITPRQPSVSNRRFDTRFFVARAPEGQRARHDNHETTASIWLDPRQALERYWAREIELAPPQIMSLVHLHRHASVESVLLEARSRRPPVILPEPFDAQGVRTICYPGDARHSCPDPALPGPTRLRFVQGRFEPDGGLPALLGERTPDA